MPENARQATIYVLVDRLVPPRKTKRARTSFWKDVLRPSCGRVQEISISDEKRENQTVRIDSADLLIVNWDAANGDSVCGSDDVFFYFMTRKDRRDALLRDGGIILCEYQSGLGVLHQQAYDVIFGADQVQVVEAEVRPEMKPGSEMKRKEDENMARKFSITITEDDEHMFTARCPSISECVSTDKTAEEAKQACLALCKEAMWNYKHVRIFSGYKTHPIIEGLPPILESKHCSDRDLFNFDDKPQKDFYWYRWRKSIYHGWFCRWEKGWVPLLIAEPRPQYLWSWYKRWFNPPPAVLLAKCDQGGLMLASTMWIAGSNSTELINNIVNIFRNDDLAKIQETHKTIQCRRKCFDVLWLLGFFVVFILRHHLSHALNLPEFPGILREIFLDFGVPETVIDFIGRAVGSFLADFGVPVTGILVFLLWWHLFWKRPYGVTPNQFVKYGWKAFLEAI